MVNGHDFHPRTDHCAVCGTGRHTRPAFYLCGTTEDEADAQDAAEQAARARELDAR